ncbi:MAG: DUF4935 domain-containing protein [Xanthomonadaceae bacterium]|nr:DUF4935 domain-containing protein [Xanthomonadaceae bacterium]
MALLTGFEQPSKKDLAHLWQEGFFVLDTSVLLNLYRYREPARRDVLLAMEKVKERLWIPFHVALEYERNRLSVISSKRSAIRKVREKMSSLPELVKSSLSGVDVFRRHSHIEMQKFLESLTKLSDEFCNELSELEKITGDVHERDFVREKIVELFAGRIGSSPSSQADIISLDKEGSARFSREQPPGYLDASKEDKKGAQAFSYAGLEYQSKYGDLYIWKQIISWAASELKKAPICFVTDDVKADWWWIIESGGPKRLGARPELIEEIRREAGTSFFHIYTPDAFLEAMNEFAGASIKPESVSEARDVSRRSSVRHTNQSFGIISELAFATWLRESLTPQETIEEEFIPDFLVKSGERTVRAYEVISVSRLDESIHQRLESRFSLLSDFLEETTDFDVRVTLVCTNIETARAAFEYLRDITWPSNRLILCAGYVEGETYKHLGCHVREDLNAQSCMS